MNSEVNAILTGVFTREATPADLQVITSLMLGGTTQVNERRVREYLEEVFTNDKYRLYVLTDTTGRIHAQCTLFIERKLIHWEKSIGHIEDLVVYSENHREEMERMILLEVQVKALQADCYKIVLCCDEKSSMKFEQFGFSNCKEIMSVYFDEHDVEK